MTLDLSLVGEAPYVVSAEDLEAITTDVWTAYLSEEHGPVYPAPVADGALDHLVHASVGVHGAWTGQVVVELSPRTGSPGRCWRSGRGSRSGAPTSPTPWESSPTSSAATSRA